MACGDAVAECAQPPRRLGPRGGQPLSRWRRSATRPTISLRRGWWVAREAPGTVSAIQDLRFGFGRRPLSRYKPKPWVENRRRRA